MKKFILGINYIMKLVALKTLQLISWKDTISFSNPIYDSFDTILISWISWKTDTAGLGTLSLRIMNLDCNIGQLQSADGKTRDYTNLNYLDPMGDVTIFTENNKPPIEMQKTYNAYTQFNYEIYIDAEAGYSGITQSNPIYLEIQFLKK